MAIAIITKYHGPTDTKGARISATAEGYGTITRAFDHALDERGNHASVARQFAFEQGLQGNWHAGSTQTGFVFVRSVRPDFTI